MDQTLPQEQQHKKGMAFASYLQQKLEPQKTDTSTNTLKGLKKQTKVFGRLFDSKQLAYVFGVNAIHLIVNNAFDSQVKKALGGPQNERDFDTWLDEADNNNNGNEEPTDTISYSGGTGGSFSEVSPYASSLGLPDSFTLPEINEYASSRRGDNLNSGDKSTFDNDSNSLNNPFREDEVRYEQWGMKNDIEAVNRRYQTVITEELSLIKDLDK